MLNRLLHKQSKLSPTSSAPKQAPPTSAGVATKQTQPLLPQYALCRFRPALDPCGGADAPQFAGLNLVPTAAVGRTSFWPWAVAHGLAAGLGRMMRMNWFARFDAAVRAS